MDTAQLDPKLKETYDRVMGAQIPQVSTPSTPPQSVQSAPPQPPLPSVAPSQTVAAEPPKQEFVSVGPDLQPIAPAAVTQKSKQGVSPFILFIAGAVFFAVYALFWFRFFSVQLPFLTQ